MSFYNAARSWFIWQYPTGGISPDLYHDAHTLKQNMRGEPGWPLKLVVATDQPYAPRPTPTGKIRLYSSTSKAGHPYE